MPKAGERVLFCLESETDEYFVGEGYINKRGVWYRFIDYPLDRIFDVKVERWMCMPEA